MTKLLATLNLESEETRDLMWSYVVAHKHFLPDDVQLLIAESKFTLQMEIIPSENRIRLNFLELDQ